ncbi:hypothetical protein [Thalassolituus hydrocarboniclasticus]|uniref:Uncharacterized protein n=1 Tax=Thalassolituus hydrocarboniclasticus TaxID=2742796 RepID=A0ABY6A7T4_9GAMM|nr:hypothetical protein [Thalassolituus hydrocarboniclasticus]UXD86685.1 hypothetical protein HUF19_04160 [Thalassolituus hydrocarboniclasticus]
MNITSYNRYQAFAVHLAVSFVIFLVLLLLVFYVWYPGIFFESEKGWKAIALIAGVDLVLGPLCTLIVFNPAKKSLKMDLAIIALLQAGALIAGSYLIHERRPVALISIYPASGFQTLYASGVTQEVLGTVKQAATPLFYYSNESVGLSGTLEAQNIKPLTKEWILENFQPISDTDHTFGISLDKGLKDNVQLKFDQNGVFWELAHTHKKTNVQK